MHILQLQDVKQVNSYLVYDKIRSIVEYTLCYNTLSFPFHRSKICNNLTYLQARSDRKYFNYALYYAIVSRDKKK